MVEVALGRLETEVVQAHLLARGAERDDAQRLRLAAREQRRAVRARQRLDVDRDLADLALGAAVRALLVDGDALADDLLLERVERELRAPGGTRRIRARRPARSTSRAPPPRRPWSRPGDRACPGRDVASSSASPCDLAISPIRPSSAFGTSISCLGLPAFFGSSTCAAHSFLIAECAMSSASRISASGTSLAPHSTISTASSVPATTRSMSAVSSCSSVGLTTKLPSTLPIRTAPTGGRVRDVGDHQRGGRAVHRQDVVRVDLVHGKREVDELRLTAPALREERPQRTIDHARDQRRLLACAALALEERAGDLARGVHALLDIHRQREEVDVAEVAGGRGGEHDGVASRDSHGAGGLLGHLAGLEGDLGSADLDGDPVHFRHMSLSCARLGSRRDPLHRLDASVVVDRHVSRRFCRKRSMGSLRRLWLNASSSSARRATRDG